MINNTNQGRWERLNVKDLNSVFVNEMRAGLNCSNFEALAILEKVHEIFKPIFEASERPSPGQIEITVVDIDVPPNVHLLEAKKKVARVTLYSTNEDLEIRKKEGVPGLRQHRLNRMSEEAFQQGGLLTLEDFSIIFNCGMRTLVADLKDLRAKNIIPPLRSTVRDMGRAISHRREIITLWLNGNEYSDIAYKSHHSVHSVSNYVEKFKRCIALFSCGFDFETIAFLVRMSKTLVEQFYNIYKECEPIQTRKEELENLAKKNNFASK